MAHMQMRSSGVHSHEMPDTSLQLYFKAAQSMHSMDVQMLYHIPRC